MFIFYLFQYFLPAIRNNTRLTIRIFWSKNLRELRIVLYFFMLFFTNIKELFK
ncbi:Uncharacterised protein [Vibrio cholerae]|nr:Uncharacterised protein [Vibrio cholerae]CSA99409.1 Uncharacterised protein [Vibrio cholerae]CSC66718.1 Uncharacterised protein [Vibrio cholerae]CSC82452.1 Uncharacterised protein [Vibrio cholerae]